MATSGFSKISISGWRQFQTIEIELHPRLTIITGANGAGKSTLLSFFTRHFGYERSYLATPQKHGSKLPFIVGIFDILKSLSRPKSPSGQEIGQITYSSGVTSTLRVEPNPSLHYAIQVENQQKVDGIHIDSHRPPNIYRPVSSFPARPPKSLGIGSGLNSEYMNYYATGQVNEGSLHHIKMTLIQMSIFGYGNSTMEPMPELIQLFSGFEAILRKVMPKSLGFQRLVIRSPEVLLSTMSGDFLIDAASGGIIKLFEVAWQLFFFSQGKSHFVVTFDEPENHLHPSMQKSFLPSIMDAFPNIQIIAVTHSPFIITALQESSVYVLRYMESEIVGAEVDDDQSIRGLLGSKVVAQRLDTVNKAGTASEILRDVLGITTTIPDWAEVRVVQIVNEFKGRAVDQGLLKQLYAQMEREGLASSYPAAVNELTRLP